MSKISFPGCGGCDGIRKDEDGTIWLTKPNPSVEAFLDRRMIRTRPHELRWVEIPVGKRIVLAAEQFRNEHEGMTGLILGKGPSLDRFLGTKHRWHVVAIGINEAALAFPCKYFFALDEEPLKRLAQGKIDALPCLQPQHVEQPFSRMMLYEWGKHTTPGYETAPVALEIAAGVFGIRTFVMVGFDGYDDGRDEYAKAIQVPARNGTEGYQVVNRHIDEVAKKWNLRLVFWHRGGAAGLEGQQLVTNPRARRNTTASATTPS